MSPKAIQMASQMVDFADRFAFSQTVAASPTAATQTTVCTLTAPADLRADAKILLVAFLSFTVGTNGVTATFKIRQTDTSGTTVATTGAETVAATNVKTLATLGIDSAPGATGQVYVATLTVGSASAGSTVSNVTLAALVI